MADVALNAKGAAQSELDYTIPGAQEIIVKSAAAAFDGSAAAGNYTPTLQVVAPDGTILASCPVGTTVAAGASVDVSWFPRVASSASAATAAVGVQQNGAPVGTEPNLNFQDGPPGIVWSIADDPGNQAVIIAGDSLLDVRSVGGNVGFEPAISFEVTSSVVFSLADDPGNTQVQIFADVQTTTPPTELLAQSSVSAPAGGAGTLVPWAKASGSSLLNLATPTKPSVAADGVYAFTLWIGWDQTHGGAAVAYSWNALLVTDPGGANAVLAAFYGVFVTAIAGSSVQTTVTLPYTGFLAAGTKLGVFVQNFHTGALSFGFGWPNGAGSSTIQQLAQAVA